MKKAILITHGPIGDAMIEAVDNIIGMVDNLFALTVTNMSVTEITQRLLSIVDAPDCESDGLIIMASLKGGSCWNVAAAIAKDYPCVRVLSGLNLPMVLSFVTKREDYSIDELVDILETEAKAGVTQFMKK